MLYGLLGSSISYTLSPAMHRYWYRHYQLDSHYQPIDVTPDQLEKAVDALRLIGFAGANVTVPYKSAVMPFLDDIDQEAEMMGAVNTIINKNGRLQGKNTDCAALIDSLKAQAETQSLGGMEALVVGAGGAGRAAVYGLLREAAKVTLVNRTADKAVKLAEDFSELGSTKVITKKEAEEDLGDFDIIIQATSLGLSPDDPFPLDVYHLKPGTCCLDLIYNPERTKWLSECRAKGGNISNGLPMLVRQGAIAFSHWSGFFPDTDGAEKFLSKYMEENDAE